MANAVNGGEGISNAHAYLGDLETVDHRQLSVFPGGKVLFPGDDLPLRMLSDSMIIGIRNLLSHEGALLAVLPPHQASTQYGVTVRVERFTVEDHSAAMTGAARQRFRLVKRLRSESSAAILWGEVEILPQDRAQSIPFDNLCWHREDEKKENETSKKRSLRKLRGRQYPAYWGCSTYALYDARVLEIELLEQVEEDIYCSMCGTFLANTREIFSMTARGAAGGTFVNPGGHVFQVLTLREVDRAHVFVDMTRSTEDTWFAGYGWSITHCNSCYQHLGWRFDRVDSHGLPATFFGFRRAALTRSRGSRRVDPRSIGLDGYDTEDYEESIASSDGSSANSEEMHLLLSTSTGTE
ncbi:uncharacterized protein PITG_08760 [Phytophthora infestans T30-4]|uniref:CULT domain-containing protein n=1 Tax=Phytophthora infestans (strain T30-4) TaxID=403677 RepID=D0ND54_PHYIT|nr:uncharacterized protein PITG_08760 [Phytophthora infestans T30-4]EEY56011.1 conserved hypothetical protein [Phytophthora infestans T30-4]|eukprot:XP_002902841.1 conserved hypothetical protein [Phytophthora infestans T30-4]